MDRPVITAAVCTCRRLAQLRRCLDSLSGQTYPREDYEIVVVDNSADGEAVEAFAASHGQGGHVRFLRQPRPGLSLARNRAIEECCGTYIAFIDDDAAAAPDWLENIVSFFSTHDEAAVAVGGRVAAHWEGSRPAWLTDELDGHFSIVNWSEQEIEISGNDHWLAGTNIAFRIDPVRACGGFRDGLGRIGNALLSNEENELLNRLRRRGGRCFYDPSVRVTHWIDVRRLTPQWVRRRVAWQVISEAIMEQVEGSAGRRLPGGTPADLPDFSLSELIGEPGDATTFACQLESLKALLRAVICDVDDAADPGNEFEESIQP